MPVQSKIGMQEPADPELSGCGSQRWPVAEAADQRGVDEIVADGLPFGGSVINDVVRTQQVISPGKGGRHIEFDFDLFKCPNSVAPSRRHLRGGSGMRLCHRRDAATHRARGVEIQLLKSSPWPPAPVTLLKLGCGPLGLRRRPRWIRSSFWIPPVQIFWISKR